MEVTVGHIIGGAVVLLGTIAGVVKAIVAYHFRSRDKVIDDKVQKNATDIIERSREWRVELSGIKDGISVREKEAREGRERLHVRIGSLDDKMQADYARKEMVGSIDERVGRVEAEMRDGFKDVNARLDTIIKMMKINGNDRISGL